MSPEVRLLIAVHDFEYYCDLAVRPVHALDTAAGSNGVATDRLALLLIEKMVGCQRARAAVAAMSDADEAAEHAHDQHASPHAPATRAARKRKASDES